jgi:hypothetical protein
VAVAIACCIWRPPGARSLINFGVLVLAIGVVAFIVKLARR